MTDKKPSRAALKPEALAETQEARKTANEVIASAAWVYAVGRNRDEAARRLAADPKFRATLAEAFRWAADRCPCTNEDGGTKDGVWFENQLRGLADAIEVSDHD